MTEYLDLADYLIAEEVLARATPPTEWTPSPEEASRALVREAVERYSDWWDSELLGGPPHREADLYPLEVLHTIVEELKLAKPRSLPEGVRGDGGRPDACDGNPVGPRDDSGSLSARNACKLRCTNYAMGM